jgi:hypothetical protein
VTFSQPAAGGDTFEPRTHFGKLLLIYPKSYDPAMKTSNGDSAAADADIIVVDSPGPDGQPLFFSNARLFGNLAKSVRNDLGGQVLGRLGQGPNTRGTPPWILTNFTDQDAAAAGPLHAAYQAGQFKPTANPMSQQQGAPAASPAAPPTPAATQPAWNPQATPAAPPAQQQWQQSAAAPAPTGQPAAPAPAQAPAGGVDPNLVAFLASKGVTVPPGMDQATAEAIARSFPQ